MNKGFLPIGSVVLLKGGTKRVMITGYCSIDNENTEKVYDYTGCLYPEGILNSNELRLFDNNQIEKVDFRGFEDQEQIDFQKILDEHIDAANKEQCDEVMTEYNNGITEVDNDEPVVMYQSDSEESFE